MKKLGLVLIAIVLTACASAGRKVDTAYVDQVKNGVQDEAQIRAWFGEPYSIQDPLQGHPSGCVKRWTYEYAEARGFGTVTYSEKLVIDFDEQGLVCDNAYVKSGET